MVAVAVLRPRPARSQLVVVAGALLRRAAAGPAEKIEATEAAWCAGGGSSGGSRAFSMRPGIAAEPLRQRPPPRFAVAPLPVDCQPRLLWPQHDGGRRGYSASSSSPVASSSSTPATPSTTSTPSSSTSRQPSSPGDRPVPEPQRASGTAPTSPFPTASSSSTEPSSSAENAAPPPPPSASTPSSSSLPSAAESRRSRLSARFSRFMDEFQDRVLVASQALNDLTGYSAIEQIKARNAQLETQLAAAQADLRGTRRAYQAVNERRAATQREVTTLLARKDSWAPADLERFTALYRADHELETGAQRAVDALQEAEAAEARLSAELTAGMLKRYHEEQVWSDRIRRQSTWGTWGLMAVNVLLFLLLQLVAEPWRRARLMRSIADAESRALTDLRQDVADMRAAVAVVTAAAVGTAGQAGQAASPAPAQEADEAAPAVVAGPDPTPAAPPAAPSLAQALRARSSWPAIQAAAAADAARGTARVRDLYSDRPVSLRMRDLSLLAVQSAAAGAVLLGGVVFALRQ